MEEEIPENKQQNNNNTEQQQQNNITSVTCKQEDQHNEKYNFMDDYFDAKQKENVQKNDQQVQDLLNNKFLLKYLTQNKTNEINQPKSYKKQNKQEILDQIKRKINFFIECDENILIHGYGSKIQLLNELQQQFSKNYPVVVVKGFLASTNIQKIICDICYIVQKYNNDDSKEIRRYDFQLNYIKKNIQNIDQKIILIINNVDSLSFRTKEIQNTLSEIAGLENLSVICSIDHYKYFILLEQETFEKFGFTHIKVDTEDLYYEEFRNLANLAQSKRNKSQSALKHVLKSFTKIQKEIIGEVAKFILEQYPQNQKKGLSFKELLERCIDEIILAKDSQLRENLLEVIDHKIILKKEINNKVVYTMNYPQQILQKLADQEEIKDEDHGYGNTVAVTDEEDIDDEDDETTNQANIHLDESSSDEDENSKSMNNSKKSRRSKSKSNKNDSDSDSGDYLS